MLTFDKYGHLTPDHPIESTVEELESAFVFNERRRSIFGKLLDFFDELRTLEPGRFLVWIDGSFTTLKKNPRDVDCVLFLNLGFYEIQDGKLSILRKSCAPLLDIYFVKVYPENDPARFLFESDRIEYLSLFSTSRDKRKKGFIQLNF